MDFGTGYRIPKLKGSSNYDLWANELTSVLKMDGLWNVTIANATQPAEPASPEGSETTPEQRDKYDSDMEKYERAYTLWDDRNNKACGIINLSTEIGPRVHIKGTDSASVIWFTLKKQYQHSDPFSYYLAVKDIIQTRQSDFKTISDYAEALQKNRIKCAETSHEIPAWLMSCFFLRGLGEDMGPYTFEMIQAAKYNKELDMDEMIAALTDHDRRHSSNSDTSKSLNFGRKARDQK